MSTGGPARVQRERMASSASTRDLAAAARLRHVRRRPRGRRRGARHPLRRRAGGHRRRDRGRRMTALDEPRSQTPVRGRGRCAGRRALRPPARLGRAAPGRRRPGAAGAHPARRRPARAAAARPLAGPRRRDRRCDPRGPRGAGARPRCGPGRHLAALRAAGQARPRRRSLARRREARARARRGRDLRVDVGHVPRGRSWRTILLLDGNIGIGGAPVQLLRRAGELLATGGAILIETDPPGAPTHRVSIRLESPDDVSEWFRWARVGADGAAEVARRGPGSRSRTSARSRAAPS